MPLIEIEWTQDYAVGVETIDRAHRDLFRISSRLISLSHNKDRHQWVGEQGIKFLKSYVISHFSEEEAYMRSINYPALGQHAEQHRVMREKILPRMESQLRHERYSEDAIDKFLSIIQLWLSRHIMVHDVAIARPGNQSLSAPN